MDPSKELFAAVNEQAVQAATPELITVEEQTYLSRQVVLPPVEPLVRPVRLRTLSGLTGFIAANVDNFEWERCLCVVESPVEVSLTGPIIGRHRQRELIAKVSCGDLEWGRFEDAWLDQESFVIRAQSLCEDTEERARLLKFVGNIVKEQSVKTADDGVSQDVEIRSGIAKRAIERWLNPVTLQPFRTFQEVGQPESPFILRLKDTDHGVCIKLIPCDGSRWELAAVANVAERLESLMSADGPKVVW